MLITITSTRGRALRRAALLRHMKPCPPQPELVKMYFLYRKEGMQPNDAWAHAMDYMDYPYAPENALHWLPESLFE